MCMIMIINMIAMNMMIITIAMIIMSRYIIDSRRGALGEGGGGGGGPNLSRKLATKIQNYFKEHWCPVRRICEREHVFRGCLCIFCVFGPPLSAPFQAS